MEQYQTINDVRRFFKLAKINATIRKIPNQEVVKINGDVENELVKCYIDGTLRITNGGDFVEVI